MELPIGQRSLTVMFAIDIGRKINLYRSKVQLLSLPRTGVQLSARRCEEGKPIILRRLCYTLVLAAFLVSTTVLGCAPVTVQQTTLQHTYTDVRADVDTTGELSQMTQQVLHMQGLQVAAQEPQRAFQDLDARSARQVV